MNTDPQTIDVLNPHRGPAFLVSLAGARWNGIQEFKGRESLAVFTDPVTQSTICLPLSQVTIGTVHRALLAKRRQYADAMGASK